MATIRKRKNSYQIRVSTGYNANGEQVTISKTWVPGSDMTEKQIEKELQRQAVLFEEECLKRQLTATSIKFEDFAEQWFLEYAYIKLKPLTLKSYRNHTIRAYKAIGHLRLDRITPRHIQTFILDMVKENLSPKSIKNHVGFVSTVMNYALRMQLVSVNPCTLATLPRMNEIEHDLYTPEEVQNFLNLLSKETGSNIRYFIFFALAIFTGCRRGELLGLE
jgi:site-specific recombinase XerD